MYGRISSNVQRIIVRAHVDATFGQTPIVYTRQKHKPPIKGHKWYWVVIFIVPGIGS
jgi:hypothetical protein